MKKRSAALRDVVWSTAVQHGPNTNVIVQAAKPLLAKPLPAALLLMVFIVVCLFNSIRSTLIICLTVPLALIGVTAGLMLTRQPFGFMALLGVLSLGGEQIKNSIVLVDEIYTQRGG